MYQDLIVRGVLLSEMDSDMERIEALVMDVRRWRHVCRKDNSLEDECSRLKSANIALLQAAEGSKNETKRP